MKCKTRSIKGKLEDWIAAAVVSLLKALRSPVVTSITELVGVCLLMAMGYIGSVIFYFLIWG